jgi:flagellar motor switch protein FliN/FliY
VAEEKEESMEASGEVSQSSAETEGASAEDSAGPSETSAEDSGGLGDAEDNDGNKELDFILDIPLEISVELGRTRMLVNDLLRLGQGAIVELTKLADEPMDIYVNRKLFARGEVVVINEKFGIRLTDIISPAERVKSLG